MKRCPKCSFLYLDSDQLCDLDQTSLIADDFGTDMAVPVKIERLEQKPQKLSLTAAVHQRKLNLKIVSAATVGGLIIGLLLMLSYQRMHSTLHASQTQQTSQAQESQASRAAQVAQQVSNEVSTNVALAQERASHAGVEDSDSSVAPNDNTSPSAKPTSSTNATTTPNTRPDSARTRASSNSVSTGDVAKPGRGSVTIRLANGSTLEADEVWRTKAGIWYRRKGIVTFLKPNRVRAINN